jgi:hypothetical protein
MLCMRLEQCLNEVKDESHDVRYGTWLKKGCRDKNIDWDEKGSMGQEVCWGDQAVG